MMPSSSCNVVRPEAENSGDFPVFGNEQAGPPERRSSYELHLPYTIALRLGWGGERGMVYFFASQPVGTDRCAGYVVIGRNYNLDQPDRVPPEIERARQKRSPDGSTLVGTTLVFTVVAVKSGVSNELESSTWTS